MTARKLATQLSKATLVSTLALSTGLSPAFAQMTEVGAGEGALSIVAWAGYVERGETDPAYDWVTKFEESSGCKVTVKTANTSDEMVALMNEGGFDLVTASGDALATGDTFQLVSAATIASGIKNPNRRTVFCMPGIAICISTRHNSNPHYFSCFISTTIANPITRI